MSARRSSDNGKDGAREARRQIADHKGAWRNRLLADRRMSNAAKVVGCAIAEHINRASKEASVGVRRLAQILHMGQGPVSEAIHELVNARRIEVEWGVQGGRKVPSAFKLIVNLETPDLFSFNKYELADFTEAETEFARQNSTEFARQNSKVRRRVRQKGRASSSNKPTEFVKSAQRVRPSEQNPVLTPGNPVLTPGVGTTDDVRESTASITSDDAAISDDEPPSQRAPDGALTPPEQQAQPPPPASPMGRPAEHRQKLVSRVDESADAPVYRRGREILGADADVVTAKLLVAYDGDAEAALDALAVAEDESDPRQYIERDIEAVARQQRGARA